MTKPRTTTEVFEDHLAKRLAGDVEGDIRTNYSPDVVFLTGAGAYKGHDGVRASSKELAKYLPEDSVFEYRHTLVEGEYAFLEWTTRSDHDEVTDGADSFVVRDGKIVFQSIHYTVGS